MKLGLKKISILSLVGIFLISVMLCCCFTNVVEAKEPVPSCHQTTQDTDSSKNTKDCECNETLAILEKDFTNIPPLEIITVLGYDRKMEYNLYSPVVSIAYHAPPIFYDSSPLYIKHSVLRI